MADFKNVLALTTVLALNVWYKFIVWYKLLMRTKHNTFLDMHVNKNYGNDTKKVVRGTCHQHIALISAGLTLEYSPVVHSNLSTGPELYKTGPESTRV